MEHGLGDPVLEDAVVAGVACPSWEAVVVLSGVARVGRNWGTDVGYGSVTV